MRIITAEEHPTRGRIKILDHQIQSNDSEGFELLGYCPQVIPEALVYKDVKHYRTLIQFRNSL